jgi:hypothetical protein
LAKAHYPELDLDLITSGIPEGGEDGAPVDEAAIRQSMLGYDQCDDLKFDNKFEVPVMYSTAIPGSLLRYT